jgi:outer membrane protein
MRAVWGVVLLTVLTVVPGAAQQPATPTTQPVEVTLNDAIQRSLQVQPAMVQARGDERTAGAARRSAFGSFLPSLTTTGSASRNNLPFRIQGDTTTFPPVYTYSGGLTLSLNLFTGFQRLWDLKTSYANTAAAGAEIVNQRYQVTLATKQVFYAAIANEELVRVAESQLERAKQQLQISIDKLHAGSATRSDSLRSTVDYGNARIALLQAQANLETAQANLGRQIGIDQEVRAVPDTSLPPMPDTSSLRSMTLEEAPQVQQADAQASAARAQVWSARAQYWPRLNVSYGNTRTGISQPQLPLLNSYPERFSWTFGFSWTLFNGFVREQNQVNASVARDNAEARAADTRRFVSAQLTQQLAALATALEQINIARDNLAAATEDLRVQNERYRVGAATILDLLTSQAAMTQAEVNVVQTRFNYLIARAQVEAVVGRTL